MIACFFKIAGGPSKMRHCPGSGCRMPMMLLPVRTQDATHLPLYDATLSYGCHFLCMIAKCPKIQSRGISDGGCEKSVTRTSCYKGQPAISFRTLAAGGFAILMPRGTLISALPAIEASWFTALRCTWLCSPALRPPTFAMLCSGIPHFALSGSSNGHRSH